LSDARRNNRTDEQLLEGVLHCSHFRLDRVCWNYAFVMKNAFHAIAGTITMMTLMIGPYWLVAVFGG
jgi:hypothetical protein